MYDQYQVIQLLTQISSKLDTLINSQSLCYSLLVLMAVSVSLACITFILTRWFKK